MSGRKALRAILITTAAIAAGYTSQPASAQQSTRAPVEFTTWLPISDAERELKSSVIEKESGAEILLWRVHVVDEYLSTGLQRVLWHYVRLKVFDANGKEKAGTVDLPYRDNGGIVDVAGRTIKADGTIVELDKKAIYKRDLVRAGGRKEKVVSFAMPGVENGAILEYRWKQTQDDNRFRYLRLEFTRDLPVQKVTYFMKPLSSDFVASDQMYVIPFNCTPTPLQQDRDGWTETTVTNVAASRDELYTPSDANIHPWALLYYRPNSTRDPQKYWTEEAKKTYNEFKGLLKPDAEQRAAATQAVADAKTDDEKIAALATFVRKRLRSIFDPEVTDAERTDFIKRLPENRERNSAEIFKGKFALSNEMNVLFAALASQVGLDVRPVLVANEREVTVDLTRLPERYFLDDVALGMKVGEGWKVFSISSRYLYPGMLDSEEQGMPAIVTDSKAALMITTPVTPPDLSVESRSAKLKLSDKGSLSGDVREGYTGYRAEEYRQRLARQSPAQREQYFHDRIVRMFPDAEVSGLKIENIEDSTQPVVVSYHMDAPFFAQITGKRIFFHPSPFRRSQAAIFSASERRYPVHFPFAWKETDQIQIELPSGFELENADNPGSFNFGDAGGYSLSMSLRKGPATELVVSRELTFGAKASISFPASAYPTVKKVFDEVQLRDSHTLALRGN
jgi:hypothetical protein